MHQTLLNIRQLHRGGAGCELIESKRYYKLGFIDFIIVSTIVLGILEPGEIDTKPFLTGDQKSPPTDLAVRLYLGGLTCCCAAHVGAHLLTVHFYVLW